MPGGKERTEPHSERSALILLTLKLENFNQILEDTQEVAEELGSNELEVLQEIQNGKFPKGKKIA